MVTVGIIDKCGVCGDATLCVVIFRLDMLMINVSPKIKYTIYIYANPNEIVPVRRG